MDLLILNTLTESRTFSSGTMFGRLGPKDAASLLYLTLILRYVYYVENIQENKTYIRKTRVFNNYDYFRVSQTDLYMLAYLLLGNHEDYKYNSSLKQLIHLNETRLNGFLDTLKNNYNRSDTFARQYFYDLEREIRVADSRYRNLRRNCINWELLSTQKKIEVLADLERFIRLIANTSEVLDDIGKVRHKYEIIRYS